ncbi:MAG TPA: (2Fe-2S)-binding protein [Thermomicrobiaceae bacterium]|nr:(2Fe-2S)-binding protein [Thermomicrobiaceae bacterium]
MQREGESVHVPVEVTVNGRRQSVQVDTRMALVDLLREQLNLTGAHIGCRTGNCGACTVLLDGETVKSCCVLAADTDGQAVTTIEALAPSPGQLHPIQQAFVDNQGLQCGFCTPGMILTAVALLKENPHPSEAEIRHGIEGNLCRCTGYQNIVKAIQYAADKTQGAPAAAGDD